MPNETRAEMLKVALVLCLVCSLAVSGAAVLLKPLQERNKAQALRAEILKTAGLYQEDRDLNELFEQLIQTRLVDLQTGEYAEGIDPLTYDQRTAARDPQNSMAIAPGEDIASIKRRANFAPVYLVGHASKPELIILPVHGYGLWSTLYALLALDSQYRIRAVSFYEHSETAGLGSEIENPRWRNQWVGKKVFDQDGEVRFRVIKGLVDPQSPDAEYQVDGLSGATLTANGVTNMMRYWMGSQGFGGYLTKRQQ